MFTHTNDLATIRTKLAHAFDSRKACQCADGATTTINTNLEHLPRRHANVVSYIRTNEARTAEEQRASIEQFCREHNLTVTQEFIDEGSPSIALAAAFKAMPSVGGLIVADINAVVEHVIDRRRDLRPFIHHFFCEQGKHLMSVKEGIDTGTASGQLAALELINSLKDDSDF